jgi:flagellar assembly factor FliW
MNVRTTLAGVETTIEVAAEQVYALEPPLGGFPELRRFVVIPEAGSIVEWLQSLDDPSIAFAMIEPFLFMPEYSFELAEGDANAIGLRSPEDAVVRCIVTLNEDPSLITANLLAPLVFCRRTHLARQIILQDADLPIRHPLFTAVAEDELAASA